MPELSEYEREMEHHFNMLYSNRFIPFTEIEAYCRLRGINTLDEREELLSVLVGIGQTSFSKKKEGEDKESNSDDRKSTTRKKPGIIKKRG